MSITKKLVIAVVALSVALCCMVGGTLAWLIASSQEVVNTFTVGNISIDINETDVDKDSSTKANEYKIVPGETIKKDPTVTVEAKSENCYVYVKVTNSLLVNKTEVATWEVNDGWTLIGKAVDSETGAVTYLYKYDSIVNYSENDQTLTPVFEEVTYDQTAIDIENIAAVAEGKITAKAYAHQSDVVDVSDVDAAACTWAGVTAITNP